MTAASSRPTSSCTPLGASCRPPSLSHVVELTGIATCGSFEGATISIKRLIGDELAARVAPIWNLNEEGEQNGAWRWLGVPNLWFMMGACLASCVALPCRADNHLQGTWRCADTTRSTSRSVRWPISCCIDQSVLTSSDTEIKAIQEGVYSKRYAP